MNQLSLVSKDGIPGDAQALIKEILVVLRERTGCDFARYRSATVYRRILNRMISLGIDSLGDYLQRLQTIEEEAARLLERVTIKVSRFYRNPATFHLLRREVLPEIARRRAGAPLRIWSAGCGCGEEAYTLAMLLDEVDVPGIVEASDIDPIALEAARAATYRTDALADLPADLAERYVEPVEVRGRQSFRVRRFVAERVRFSRHDITTPLPLPNGPRFDLICCRNVLIYLQRDTHEETQRHLRDALVPGGYLCLGEAESPAAGVAASFESFARKSCLFVYSNGAR